MREEKRKYATDRAPPKNGAQELRPTPVESELGLPCPGRARLKKLAQTRIRFATWNIGTLTGRWRELANVLFRRRVTVAFLQETRWKGNRSRLIGHGYKLIYTGAPSGGSGVAVVLSEELQDDILEVKRFCDRLMAVRVLINGTVTHLISAYAPQAGCSDAERGLFWGRLGDVLRDIPLSQEIVLGGDLNGHVGSQCQEFERVHGGLGYGIRNAGGGDILRTCAAADLAIVNTYFQKKPEHLITYKSGGRATQIDFLLTRRHHISKVANCKVIPGESLTAQHRLLVMDLCVKLKEKRVERCQRRIRWWLLDEDRSRKFASEIGDKCAKTESESVQEYWNKIQAVILEAAKAVLGVSKGGRKCDKETWWWNDTVQRETKMKKALFKKWQASGSPEDRDAYIAAKRATKKAVARARSDHIQPLYDRLESSEGQKLIYKLARSRINAAQDISKCRCVKDSRGNLLCEDLAVRERWRLYFHELLNKQHKQVQPPDLPPNQGLVLPITSLEVQTALRRSMNRKAVGADGVPIEAWKAMGLRGVDILSNLFNRVLLTGKIPGQWRMSVITPVFKGKGSVQECGNYRGIKVMSHTMKILERIIDSRIRQECTVSECQYGFRPGRGVMDPVFALRIVAEKYRTKNTPLHCLFLDMQKAFDCVPRMVIWWALRSKGVPEIYIDVIRDMYRHSSSLVRTAVGDTKPFPITVGVHQGSVLSPFLFSVILDVLSDSIKDPHEQPPWLLMYADDIALTDMDRGRLIRRVKVWKETLESSGLKLNVAKTEYLALNTTDPTPVRIGDDLVERTDHVKYLGSIFHSSGDIDCDVRARIAAAWAKWREMTGILCDPKMPVKLKGQVYKTIIRPVLLHGCEAWPLLERHKQELHVTEMNMLRWMCGVTRIDRVRNSRIRGSLRVRDIADKLQEYRLRWYGHVLRQPPSYVGNKCLAMPPPPGTGKRGRPKKCWLDVVRDDMRANSLTTQDAEDRAKWRKNSRKADPGRPQTQPGITLG